MQDARVRVLQLVAADRWTGAAATALQLTEALRAAGVDCHFAYRPGRSLEQRLAGLGWAHPVLVKERTPGDVRGVVWALRELSAGVDVVHVHLPHDHVLARIALARKPKAIYRSFHHSGHLRHDPFHRLLYRGVAGAGIAHSEMLGCVRRFSTLAAAPVEVLPVALEECFLAEQPRNARRAALGIPTDAVVAGTIGKLDRGRGHDLFIRAVGATPRVWGMIIGKGPSEPALRRLAHAVGVEDRLVFTGYVEGGLEQFYASMDLFVFPAAGSDHAHRAIAEASACGVPTLAADLPGVRDLIEVGETGELYRAADAAALAANMRTWAESSQRRERAGACARARACSRWTDAKLAAAAFRLYGGDAQSPRLEAQA
jgi:glycosyltransferase involved in cell wall biosynthesis